MPHGIYLDNSTTARPSQKALSKMMPFLTDRWGHPSQPHQMGQELYPAMQESYKAIYALLGTKESASFVFTSSGAEAVNQVFLSTYLDVSQSSGKNQFITSNVDEAPALMSIGRLEHMGCVGKMVHAGAHGVVTVEALGDAISPRTALVSLSWANGLTGVVQPVAEISQVCQQRGIALHLDATHVLGKLFYDLEEIKPTFLTFNGAQLHAPKGTGGLSVKEGTKCSPFIVGGIEQGGKRAGSFDVAALVALGQASLETLETRDLLCTEVARLRDKLESNILEGFPEAQILLKGVHERLPHCTAIAFPGMANEALLYTLNRKGVFASIGGGCFQQLALILAASGIPDILAHTAVSFSLSRETTEDEVDRASEIICEAAKRLRKLSHVFEG
ncbi:MAG: cysteine desulfurase [Parachlamydia sp.]|nr:cysteine desulfurase [Parachlamydia sp.]